MPNHVTHYCVVTGPESEVARFVEKMIRKEEGRVDTEFLDFNQVIPMPEPIKKSESCSSVNDGLAVLGYDSGFGTRKPVFIGKEQALKRYLDWPWIKEAGVTTIEGVAEKLVERNTDIVKKAKDALRNVKEYGHTDWYGWSIENWGTKWNSYDFCWDYCTPLEVAFRFDTAWSFPEPVFDAIAKEFPELDIDVSGFDEGHCFCVRAQYGNGINVVKYNERECDPKDDPFAAEVYERAYDKEYEPYDEDE